MEKLIEFIFSKTKIYKALVQSNEEMDFIITEKDIEIRDLESKLEIIKNENNNLIQIKMILDDILNNYGIENVNDLDDFINNQSNDLNGLEECISEIRDMINNVN